MAPISNQPVSTTLVCPLGIHVCGFTNRTSQIEHGLENSKKVADSVDVLRSVINTAGRPELGWT